MANDLSASAPVSPAKGATAPTKTIEDVLIGLPGMEGRSLTKDNLTKGVATQVFLLSQQVEAANRKADLILSNLAGTVKGIAGNQQAMMEENARMQAGVSRSVKAAAEEAFKQAAPQKKEEDVMDEFEDLGVPAVADPFLDDDKWAVRREEFLNAVAPEDLTNQNLGRFKEHTAEVRDLRQGLRFLRHTAATMLALKENQFSFLKNTDPEILRVLPTISQQAVSTCCKLNLLQTEHLRMLRPTFFTWIGQLGPDALKAMFNLDKEARESIRAGNTPDSLKPATAIVLPAGSESDKKSVAHLVKGSLSANELEEADFEHLQFLLEEDQVLLSFLKEMDENSLRFIQKMSNEGKEVLNIGIDDAMAFRGRIPVILLVRMAQLSQNVSKLVSKLDENLIDVILYDVTTAPDALIHAAGEVVPDGDEHDEQVVACYQGCSTFLQGLDEYLLADLKGILKDHREAVRHFCYADDRMGVVRVIYRRDLLSLFGKSKTFSASLWEALKPDTKKDYTFSKPRGAADLFSQRLLTLHGACVACDSFDDRMSGFKAYLSQERDAFTRKIRALLSENELMEENCEKEIDRMSPIVHNLTLAADISDEQLEFLATVEGCVKHRENRLNTLKSNRRTGIAGRTVGTKYLEELRAESASMKGAVHDEDQLLFSYSFICFIIEGSRSWFNWIRGSEQKDMYVPWKKTFKAWYYYDRDGGSYISQFQFGNPVAKQPVERDEDGELPEHIQLDLEEANKFLAAQSKSINAEKEPQDDNDA